MNNEQNKINARRIVEESWNKHNTKVLDELFANDAPLHDPQNPNGLKGPQGAKSTLETYLTAFPDLKITIEGHTDSTSTAEHNQQLSEKRANAVKIYLTTAGIDGALKLAALLCGDRAAQEIQLGIEYAPEPPFQSGTPKTAPPEVLEAARAAARPLTQAREATAKRIAAGLGIEVKD